MRVAARRGRPAHGFTVIELLVVLGVLGVLAAMVLPMAQMQAQRDKEQELRRALWEIRDAIDAYKRAVDAGAQPRAAQASGYPPSLEALVTGIEDQRPGSNGRRLHFLRRVPRDPFADLSLPAGRTWGLRSYQSPADKPRPGDDVYDVYSQSAMTGLNGLPLREW